MGNGPPIRQEALGPNRGGIAVVIPCYRVERYIEQVLASIPDTVSGIIVVDDCCPDGSGRIAERLAAEDPRITVLFRPENGGVGAAVMTGYAKAVQMGFDVLVKVDGDGQMDPSQIPRLVEPLFSERADYAKGNRFQDFEALKQMPKARLFGNSVLSFLVKAASGYWNIMDPTNGFTAIHRRALGRLETGRISGDYFFESDMLINLSLIRAVVEDVPIAARYGDEPSSLRIRNAALRFPFRLLRGLLKRIFVQYFIYDFNMASVYLLVGLPIFSFGAAFGITEWLDSIITGTPKSSGTIMVAALPIITSFQMLLQAVQIDIGNVPRKLISGHPADAPRHH